MGGKRLWTALGAVALAAAVVLAPASPASADYIRDAEWTLDVYGAQDVWAQSQGQGVTVGIVDTGVDGKLPDLTGQVLPGKDFSEGGQGAQIDTDGHGTSMAGIIAGHGHGAGHASGVMGLAPKAKILPLRAAQGDHDIDIENWSRAIRYAVDQGASVINLSFNDTMGTPGSDGAQAVAYAEQHNVVVVAAVGNDAEEYINYPAALPGVVAVGAVDTSLHLSKYSNYGKGVVLTAPGDSIVTTDPTEPNGYERGDGTSQATAMVSAEAALIRAKFPALTAGQVINRMIKSATFANNEVSGSPDAHYGYGIIRPYEALTMDIPAGPAQGPLPQPSATSGSQLPQAASPSHGSSSGLLMVAVVGVAVVVVSMVVAVVLVAVLRRRRDRPGGPGGSGGFGLPGGPFPPPPYPGQVPQYGPPPQYGQPQPQQPPYQGS